ncbi:11775_t:CDS:1, partial [Cetraspora pellucida]
MGSLKYFIYISALTYLFTLIASVDPTTKCENSESSINSNEQRALYNVIVNSVENKDSQLGWLNDCHNRNIGRSTESIRSVKDTNYVKDFSVDGFYGYSGWFAEDMATNTIMNKDGTLVVEKDGIVKINYVVPRTIQRKPEP